MALPDGLQFIVYVWSVTGLNTRTVFVAPGASSHARRTLTANAHDVFGPANTPPPQSVPRAAVTGGVVLAVDVAGAERAPLRAFVPRLRRFFARWDLMRIARAQPTSRSEPCTVGAVPATVG